MIEVEGLLQVFLWPGSTPKTGNYCFTRTNMRLLPREGSFGNSQSRRGRKSLHGDPSIPCRQSILTCCSRNGRDWVSALSISPRARIGCGSLSDGSIIRGEFAVVKTQLLPRASCASAFETQNVRFGFPVKSTFSPRLITRCFHHGVPSP